MRLVVKHEGTVATSERILVLEQLVRTQTATATTTNLATVAGFCQFAVIAIRNSVLGVEEVHPYLVADVVMHKSALIVSLGPQRHVVRFVHANLPQAFYFNKCVFRLMWLCWMESPNDRG